MKIQKVLILFFFFVFFFHQSFSQKKDVVDNYEYSNFYFKGIKGEKSIYQFNYPITTSSEVGDRYDLYYPVIDSDNRVLFKFYKSFDYHIYYLKENLILVGKSDPDSMFLMSENEEKSIEKIGSLNFYRRTHYLTQGNYFYFSTEINKINYLARVDISAEKPNVEIIPLKGRNPIVYKNWLFYEIGYVSPKYSSPPSALYRVKIGDWRNPELIVNDVYSVGTVVDENIISFRIYLDKEMKHITYNLSDSTYIEKGISSLIKYKEKKYQRTLCKNPETGKTQLCFKNLPELPDKFPHKLDRDTEPNHNYFHLPHTEKPFTGTFITDSLMFYAGKDELQKLSKSQLRMLRNAFYAREGYDFNSTDLKELFSQFDWYEKTLERRKAYNMTNDDIYISPADKERIDLILEIERNK